MKAFRDVNTLIAFTDGFQVYYNYLKPHYALKGKTPAEAAKIQYDAKNWVDICHLSTPKQKPKAASGSKHSPSHGMPTITPKMRRITPKPPRISPPPPRITPKVGKIK